MMQVIQPFLDLYYKNIRVMFPAFMQGYVDAIVGLIILGLVIYYINAGLKKLAAEITGRLTQAAFRILPPPRAADAKRQVIDAATPAELADAGAKLDAATPITQQQLVAKAGQEPLTRQDALALFDHLARTLKVEAAPATREAFANTVQTISAEPKQGERDALVALAQGNTGDAVKFLETEADATPDHLQTLAVLTSIAAPDVSAEAFSRYASATVSRKLGPEHVPMTFTSPQLKGVTIGFMTGDIGDIRNMDAWVNSENDWLLMARPMERSIAANIRYLSARHVEPKAGEEEVNGKTSRPLMKNDPIQRYLRPGAYGRLKRVPLGSVRTTASGQLKKTHNVKRILHVVAVTAYPLDDIKPGPQPGDYVRDVMRKAERFNRHFLRFDRDRIHSMVVPMFGTGLARVNPESVTDQLVDGLLRGIAAISEGRPPHLKTVNLLAYSTREYIPLRRSFEKRVAMGDLTLVQGQLSAG